MFDFTAPVQLLDVTFALSVNPNNNKFKVYNCTAVGVGCVGATQLGSESTISGSTNTVTIAFSTSSANILEFIGTNPNSSFGINALDFTVPSPEPATFGIVGVSLIGLAGLHFRRRKRS